MNVSLFLDRLAEEAPRAGFAHQPYTRIENFSLPVLHREATHPDAPRVYLSAGIHGDEPAGPMAILDLLRRREFPDCFTYTLYPLLNPRALNAGSRTTPEGLDLNRDYGPSPRSAEVRAHKASVGEQAFEATLCLHEDYEGEGFYLFSHQRVSFPVDIPHRMLQAAQPHTGIDPRPLIDDMPAVHGLMQPPREIFNADRPDLPEAVWLYFQHAPWITVTTETPSLRDLPTRVAAQRAAVLSLLADLPGAAPNNG